MKQRSEHGIVSVVGRWDFRVCDLAAVLESGRAAYRLNHPETTDRADAEVLDAEGAVEQLLEAFGMDAVYDTDGLEPVRVFTVALAHDEDDDETFAEDPFAIAYEEDDEA